jgi:hypothetical protein
MASTHGFKHLHLIAKSLNELYRRFGRQHLTSYADTFTLGTFADDLRRDPIIGTQYLAKRIAGHYRLPVTTVIVTFTSPTNQPGHVELSHSNEFFVELEPQYRSVPKAIAAILAHEVAHIFLHRCGVRFSVEFENEILTDTTAVYVGFGPTMLNAVTETTRKLTSKNLVQVWTHHFGYLTLDEFGYVLAKRDAVYGTDSAPKIDPGTPSAAFERGRARCQGELRHRPFVIRPRYQRLFHLLSGKGNSSAPGIRPITLSCPCCSQPLRIPKAHRKLSVRCPNCDSQFLCYS